MTQEEPPPEGRSVRIAPSAESFTRIAFQKGRLVERVTERTEELARQEADELCKSRQQEELREFRARNQDAEDTLDLRRKYAKRAIILAYVAVGFWIVMFITSVVCNLATGRVVVSDEALMTLTAGATVNVLAAFIGIVRGLFPSASRGGKKKAGK